MVTKECSRRSPRGIQHLQLLSPPVWVTCVVSRLGLLLRRTQTKCARPFALGPLQVGVKTPAHIASGFMLTDPIRIQWLFVSIFAMPSTPFTDQLSSQRFARTFPH